MNNKGGSAMNIKKNNQDLRDAIQEAGLKHYHIAKQLGVREGQFSTMLRFELEPDEKGRVFLAIDEARKTFI